MGCYYWGTLCRRNSAKELDSILKARFESLFRDNVPRKRTNDFTEKEDSERGYAIKHLPSIGLDVHSPSHSGGKVSYNEL